MTSLCNRLRHTRQGKSAPSCVAAAATRAMVALWLLLSVILGNRPGQTAVNLSNRPSQASINLGSRPGQTSVKPTRHQCGILRPMTAAVTGPV